MSIDSKIYIYPTDTVWGLGADIYNEAAQTRINKIKKSPEGKPISVVFKNIEMLSKYIQLPDASTFNWDEAFSMELTFLIPKEFFQKVPSWIIQGSDYVGVRMLDLEIFNEIDFPITTTSLNLHGFSAIISLEDAKAFREKYCSGVSFISTTESLSGKSSSIILFKNGSFKIIRKGFRIDEISKTLGL